MPLTRGRRRSARRADPSPGQQRSGSFGSRFDFPFARRQDRLVARLRLVRRTFDWAGFGEARYSAHEQCPLTVTVAACRHSEGFAPFPPRLATGRVCNRESATDEHATTTARRAGPRRRPHRGCRCTRSARPLPSRVAPTAVPLHGLIGSEKLPFFQDAAGCSTLSTRAASTSPSAPRARARSRAATSRNEDFAFPAGAPAAREDPDRSSGLGRRRAVLHARWRSRPGSRSRTCSRRQASSTSATATWPSTWRPTWRSSRRTRAGRTCPATRPTPSTAASS